VIVDGGISVDGHRSAPRSPEGTRDAWHDRGGFAWIGLYEPTEEDLQFHRVSQPLTEALAYLLKIESYDLDGELHKYPRDVRNRTLRVTEQVVGFHELLFRSSP
jgi:hypothetical protein